MKAKNYPPINVLSVCRGILDEEIPYHLTPYRFTKQNGETHRIKDIRHFHKDRKGKGEHFHYVVRTRENRYFRLLFDSNSFTWRLIEERFEGVTKNY